jgi:hypothetical protein
MDNETVNVLMARTSALERVVILLLAGELKRLPQEESEALAGIVTGAIAPPPRTTDLGVADDLAGRRIAFEETVLRILRDAREIADVPEA